MTSEVVRVVSSRQSRRSCRKGSGGHSSAATATPIAPPRAVSQGRLTPSALPEPAAGSRQTSMTAASTSGERPSSVRAPIPSASPAATPSRNPSAFSSEPYAWPS